MSGLTLIKSVFVSDIKLMIVGSLQCELTGRTIWSRLGTATMFVAGIILCTLRLLTNILRYELHSYRHLIQLPTLALAYQVYACLHAIKQAIAESELSNQSLPIITVNIIHLFVYLIIGIALTVYRVLLKTNSQPEEYVPRTATFDWNDMAWVKPPCTDNTYHGIYGNVDNILVSGQSGTASSARVCSSGQGDGPSDFRMPTGKCISGFMRALKIIPIGASVYSIVDRILGLVDCFAASYTKWFSASDSPILVPEGNIHMDSFQGGYQSVSSNVTHMTEAQSIDAPLAPSESLWNGSSSSDLSTGNYAEHSVIIDMAHIG